LALKAQLVVLGERFRDGQYSLVSFFCCSSTHGSPRAQPFVKIGGRNPVPHGVGATGHSIHVVKFFICFHVPYDASQSTADVVDVVGHAPLSLTSRQELTIRDIVVGVVTDTHFVVCPTTFLWTHVAGVFRHV